MKKTKQDFTQGPLFMNLLSFAFPVMLTNLLQILYNAADKFVIGRFSGDEYALGAIGCTTFIYALIVNSMAGIGGGAGVVVAQLYGAGRKKETSRAVHTAMTLSLSCAAVFTTIAYTTEMPLLRLLGTQDKFMANASLYLNIIFIGITGCAIYNFGAAILRAIGDSKTPLVIGMLSGIINVGLNLVFVLLFKMSVSGVALATIISQFFSAITVVVVLMRRKGESYQFKFSSLGVDKRFLLRILRLGVPTGLQSCCFSVTNMAASWAVNTFPAECVTAHSISSNIDGMVDACSGAFLHSSMNATGQNWGAGDTKRVKKVFVYSLIQAMGVTFLIAQTLRIFRADLAAMFVDTGVENYQVIVDRVSEWTGMMLLTYFLQGAMNSVIGSVRGMGYSITALIMNVLGTCVTRLLWVFVIFPMPEFNTFVGLSLMYPFSWGASTILIGAISIFAFIKLDKTEKKIKLAEAAEEEKTAVS